MNKHYYEFLKWLRHNYKRTFENLYIKYQEYLKESQKKEDLKK